jgi:hypothetical protein
MDCSWMRPYSCGLMIDDYFVFEAHPSIHPGLCVGLLLVCAHNEKILESFSKCCTNSRNVYVRDGSV